jgi:hypothetical protein
MKTKDNDNMSLIRLLPLSPPARHRNSGGHPPNTHHEERPQRRAQCAYLCASAPEKSTNDPGMSMKTKDNDNLPDTFSIPLLPAAAYLAGLETQCGRLAK